MVGDGPLVQKYARPQFLGFGRTRGGRRQNTQRLLSAALVSGQTLRKDASLLRKMLGEVFFPSNVEVFRASAQRPERQSVIFQHFVAGASQSSLCVLSALRRARSLPGVLRRASSCGPTRRGQRCVDASVSSRGHGTGRRGASFGGCSVCGGVRFVLIRPGPLGVVFSRVVKRQCLSPSRHVFVSGGARRAPNVAGLLPGILRKPLMGPVGHQRVVRRRKNTVGHFSSKGCVSCRNAVVHRVRHGRHFASLGRRSEVRAYASRTPAARKFAPNWAHSCQL